MTVSKHVRAFTMAAASLLASLLLADAAQPLKIDFSSESAGAEPKSFLSVVGVWRIESFPAAETKHLTPAQPSEN